MGALKHAKGHKAEKKAKKAVKKAARAPHGPKSCKKSCASKKTMEYKNTCQEQCRSDDEYCMNMCAHPLRKCQCRCYAHRKWECRNKRCSCWKEQGQATGAVAEAARHAENKALAAGLGKAAAR